MSVSEFVKGCLSLTFTATFFNVVRLRKYRWDLSEAERSERMIGFCVDFAVPGTCVTWLRKSFSLR